MQLPSGKAAKELGIKLGDRFRVADAYVQLDITQGDIVSIIEDDDSSAPFFIVERTQERVCVSLDRLVPLNGYVVGQTLIDPVSD